MMLDTCTSTCASLDECYSGNHNLSSEMWNRGWAERLVVDFPSLRENVIPFVKIGFFYWMMQLSLAMNTMALRFLVIIIIDCCTAASSLTTVGDVMQWRLNWFGMIGLDGLFHTGNACGFVHPTIRHWTQWIKLDLIEMTAYCIVRTCTQLVAGNLHCFCILNCDIQNSFN